MKFSRPFDVDQKRVIARGLAEEVLDEFGERFA
jgi:hypothetical protein